MPELPSGTVTFLFTDIEGSTRMVQKLGEDFPALLDEHCDLMNSTISAQKGVVVGTEGDSFFAAFKSAEAALQAVVESQRALHSHKWPWGIKVKVRMGLHTGEGILGGENYTGIDVHRAARISAAGHGGQVLISATTYELVAARLADGLSVKDLGDHRLKDLDRPERIYQLVIAGLPSEFPMIRSLLARPNNLPAQLTSFVGRESEVANIVELMSKTRLLTLTGPGGTGKTRLSLKAAGELLGSFSDGVFFVALAPITDPSLVLPAIAETLGLKEAGKQSAADILKGHLAGQQMLLVLDNFEQVIGGAVGVAELLEAAPEIKVLVTSRERLHLSGEQEYPVPPLGLPDFHNLPPLEQLGQYEAVALFIQRGSAVRPNFKVTNENAPAVAEICDRLDGLPLAIELAAARLKILTPQAILARLQSRLGLLTGGGSDLPARQQTLRNAIAWSYDLLDDSERQLFRRLGVFTGGWTLEAADAVCSDERGTDLDMVDGLASMVDKSLVRQQEGSSEEPRFMMLETIREFALDTLSEQEDSEAIRSRHAGYFLQLAEDAAFYLTGDPARVRQLDAEHDNLRAVFGFCLQTGKAEEGLRLGAAAWRFWQLQGHFREGRKWLTEVLALPQAQRRTTARAKGLSALGSIAYWQNDIETTFQCYEESLSIFRDLGDDEGIAEQLYNLSFAATVVRDYPKARRLSSEAMAMYKRLGNTLAIAYGQHAMSMIAFLEANPAESFRLAADTLSVFEEANERFGIANALGMLAQASLALGNVDQASKYGKQSMEGFRELGDFSGIAWCMEQFAEMALIAENNSRRAVVLAGAAAALKQKLGGAAPPSLAPFSDFKTEAARDLQESEIEAAWQEGAAMSWEEGMDYALKEPC